MSSKVSLPDRVNVMIECNNSSINAMYDRYTLGQIRSEKFMLERHSMDMEFQDKIMQLFSRLCWHEQIELCILLKDYSFVLDEMLAEALDDTQCSALTIIA